ncbi:MAG: sugar phosphate isomerase/epimerase [Gemmatimonadota bacterium]|nr:sugar phosphate isomerase/epimerase [Gemmatimonadota bacterium]
MKLGIVTYQIAKDWDVPALLDMCQTTGIHGVELRTTHAHGVEIELSSAERSAVRRRFENAGVDIVGLGGVYEYHAADLETVRQNIEGTVEYARLAADLGCPGVKVRPNGLQTDKGVPEEQTLEQIGRALGECGEAAAGLGVRIRVEVHGRDTCEPRRMRAIIDHADHENVHVCWNSNPQDVVNGSVRTGFDLLKHKIGLVHINELHKAEYPWRELFGLLKAEGYDGYTLAEIPDSPEPERLLRYYKALWEALVA